MHSLTRALQTLTRALQTLTQALQTLTQALQTLTKTLQVFAIVHHQGWPTAIGVPPSVVTAIG